MDEYLHIKLLSIYHRWYVSLFKLVINRDIIISELRITTGNAKLAELLQVEWTRNNVSTE